MKENFAEFLKEKNLKRLIWTDGIILFIFIAASVWKWSTLPLQLPLFYSLPRGPEQLGTPLELLILPVFALIFSLINLTIPALLFTKEKLASIILIAMAMIVSFLLLLTFIKIVFLIS